MTTDTTTRRVPDRASSTRLFYVRIREVGAARHIGLGRDQLTNRLVHVLRFTGRDHAVAAAKWALENNAGPDGFDSAQIVDAETGRVVKRLERPSEPPLPAVAIDVGASEASAFTVTCDGQPYDVKRAAALAYAIGFLLDLPYRGEDLPGFPGHLTVALHGPGVDLPLTDIADQVVEALERLDATSDVLDDSDRGLAPAPVGA